jgi:hypothetical protein
VRELIITIDETTGELRVDITGYAGAACEEAVRLIEAVMGRPPDVSRTKPEYHVRPPARIRPGGRPGQGWGEGNRAPGR